MDIVQAIVVSEGNLLSPMEVVAGCLPGGEVYLVILVDIKGYLPVLSLEDAVSIAIVGEGGEAGDGGGVGVVISICIKTVFPPVASGSRAEDMTATLHSTLPCWI